jgi:hypothetical protein
MHLVVRPSTGVPAAPSGNDYLEPPKQVSVSAPFGRCQKNISTFASQLIEAKWIIFDDT